MEKSGNRVPEEHLKNFVFVFQRDKVRITQKDGGQEPEQTFTLDSSKSPRWIDVTPEARGIYELSGDTLKIRFMKRGDRPTIFDGATKQSEVLLVLKRAKP